VNKKIRTAWFHIPDIGICLFLSQLPWSEQRNLEQGFCFVATGVSIPSSHTFFTSLISGGSDVFLVAVADVRSFTFFVFFSLGHLFVQSLVIQGAVW